MLSKKRILIEIFFLSLLMAITMLLLNDATAGINYDSYTTGNSGEQKRVIWREDIYDVSIKANVSVIKLDENYFANITDPEKAVLGYLASTIGNECYAESGKQNVKCKILSALGMSYQCSDDNKSFLKNWFRDDAAITSQIENCKPTIASTIEKTFDEVKIESDDNMIKVDLKGLKLNIKENSASKWSEKLSFKIDGDKLTLIERIKRD
jgi:hypothetical protein